MKCLTYDHLMKFADIVGFAVHHISDALIFLHLEAPASFLWSYTAEVQLWCIVGGAGA